LVPPLLGRVLKNMRGGYLLSITVSRVDKSGMDEYLRDGDGEVEEFDSEEEAVSHLQDREINSKIIATFSFHKGE